MVYAGIDVGKERLDLALLVWPEGRSRGKSRGRSKGKPEGKPEGKVTLHRFPNSEQGRAALVRLLTRQQSSLEQVALESSGVYHLPLLQRLVASCIPVALANPYQVAAFRKASGVRNKTDSQDALLLARYALTYKEELVHYRPPPRVVTELKEVLTYREQLLGRLRQVENQIEVVFWKRMAEGGAEGDAEQDSKRRSERYPERRPKHPPKTLAWLREEEEQIKARLVEVEAEVQRLLQLIPESEVLMLQKGVGAQVAAAVLAYLPPELWGRAKPASAYAGLVPEQQYSGSSIRRSRLSRKGPVLLRKKLYLAALVAIRHDPEMKAFYHRLLANHKSKKQALVAVAHKILRRLMGKLKAYYKGKERRAQGEAQGEAQDQELASTDTRAPTETRTQALTKTQTLVEA